MSHLILFVLLNLKIKVTLSKKIFNQILQFTAVISGAQYMSHLIKICF